jgi:hypothetical protein
VKTANYTRSDDNVFDMAFIFAAVFLLLIWFLSNNVLLLIYGPSFLLTGGSPLVKIHPATFFGTFAVITLYFSRFGDRLRQVVFVESPAILYYFICLGILILYNVIFLDVAFTLVVDTFGLAGFAFCLLSILNKRQLILVGRLFDVLIALNSFVGIVESLTNWRIVPLGISSAVLGQIIYPIEWRAGAFLGHPLTNAYVTGAYLLTLILTNRIPNMAIRFGLVGLHLVALTAFGSRAAIGALAVMVVLYLVYHFAKAFVTGKINRNALVFGSVILPLLALGALVVISSGFADRFIGRFIFDNGSASARSIMFDMLSGYTWSDLLFAPPYAVTVATEARYGIIAIENFWLNFLFTRGIIGCAIFLPALFFFCRAICRRTDWAITAVMIYFFALCSTSISLASKTPMFGIIVFMCLTQISDLVRQREKPEPGTHYPLRSRLIRSPLAEGR